MNVKVLNLNVEATVEREDSRTWGIYLCIDRTAISMRLDLEDRVPSRWAAWGPWKDYEPGRIRVYGLFLGPVSIAIIKDIGDIGRLTKWLRGLSGLKRN